MWKKIAESTDLISFEHKSRALTTRLEARLLPDSSWVIFKKYYNDDGVSYTEEYHAKSKDEAHYLIDNLKSRILDRQGVEKAREIQKQGIKLHVRRTFKEYNVERWEFSIDDDDYANFVYLRFEDRISLDIGIHGKYKIWEAQILSEIMSIFGLAKHELDVSVNMFFYAERNSRLFKGRHSELFISRIEMGLPDDMDDR